MGCSKGSQEQHLTRLEAVLELEKQEQHKS